MKSRYRLPIFSISSQITDSYGIMPFESLYATHKIGNRRDRTGPGALRASSSGSASQTRKEADGTADFSGEPARTVGFAPGDRQQIVGFGSVHRYGAQHQQHCAKNPHRSG